MASAKAWYWLGLGVVTLSMISSGSGRSLMNRATGYVACARAYAVPYVGAIELALGRTQAGVGHLQAVAEHNRARLEAERAQIEAARELLRDERVQEQLRRAQQLADRAVMERALLARRVTVTPGPLAMPEIDVTNAGPHVIVCPSTRVRVTTPAVHVSTAPIQQPI